jgi:hypothetical protein
MMSKLVSVCIAVALGASGCSFALQPKRTLDPRRPQPSAAPVFFDGVLATTAMVLGVTEESVTCSSEQWLCLSSIDHAIGGVAIGLAAVYAISALYGYGRYTGSAEAPDMHSSDLANHVSIAAHTGDCATAAGAAEQLHATDQNAYAGLLDDEVVQRCLLQASDAERRAVLDTIAHSPNTIPLAGSRAP